MKLILSLLLISSTLFASSILSYKVYDRSDRTDLLLTFDTPFSGRISQKHALNQTTLLLYDAQYSKQIEKNVQSKYISSFSIIPQNKRTALVLTLNDNTLFKVSKTVDNYGLRLRFYKGKAKASQAIMTNGLATLNKTNTLPTKAEASVSNEKYIIVVLILFLAVLLMFFIKRRVEKGNQGSWLFKNQTAANEQFNILFQKPIDNINKVVLMEVNQKQYLVVLGSSHLLLDTFADKKNIDQDGFESILQDNQQELDNYMQLGGQDKLDPLQSYKEKASLEAYRSNM